MKNNLKELPNFAFSEIENIIQPKNEMANIYTNIK